MMFDKHRGEMPAKEIMKLASVEWRKQNHSKDVTEKKPSKRTTRKSKMMKDDKGGSLLGEILGFGLDKQPKKKQVKMMKDDKGGSLLGEILGFGLDKQPKKKQATRKPRKPAMKKAQEEGAGIFGDLSGVLQGISSVADPLIALASGHGGALKKQDKQAKQAKHVALSNFMDAEGLQPAQLNYKNSPTTVVQGGDLSDVIQSLPFFALI